MKRFFEGLSLKVGMRKSSPSTAPPITSTNSPSLTPSHVRPFLPHLVFESLGFLVL